MMPRRLTEGGSAPLQGSRLGWQWRSWRGGDVIESLCMQLPRHGDSIKGAGWGGSGMAGEGAMLLSRCVCSCLGTATQ
jgi:hypothetical protein